MTAGSAITDKMITAALLAADDLYAEAADVRMRAAIEAALAVAPTAGNRLSGWAAYWRDPFGSVCLSPSAEEALPGCLYAWYRSAEGYLDLSKIPADAIIPNVTASNTSLEAWPGPLKV